MKLKTALATVLLIYAGAGFFIRNTKIGRSQNSGREILSPVQGDPQDASMGFNDESLELGKKIDEFFCERYKLEKDSTLCGDGDSIVSIGNRFGTDPILLTAISFRETTACKFARGFNCMGVGYYNFWSHLESVEYVAEMLAGEGRDGHYYLGKTELEKLRTYNSVIPTYAEEVEKIKEEIKR